MKIFSRELDNPGINDVIGSIDIFHAMLVRELGSDFSGGGDGKKGDGVHAANARRKNHGGRSSVGEKKGLG